MRGLGLAILGAAFLVALGFVGRLDFEDELRAAVLYCDNVAATLDGREREVQKIVDGDAFQRVAA